MRQISLNESLEKRIKRSYSRYEYNQEAFYTVIRFCDLLATKVNELSKEVDELNNKIEMLSKKNIE